MSTPSQNRLKQVLWYIPETGAFIWKPRGLSEFNGKTQLQKLWNDRFANKAAGCNKGRYTNLTLDGRTHWCHRLVWVYCFGSLPMGQIDHRNGNTYDNRLTNLREVTPSGNSENRRRPISNKKHALPLGVHFRSRPGLSNPYSARITALGVRYYLGSFSNADAAHAAYVSAKRTLHAHGTL